MAATDWDVVVTLPEDGPLADEIRTHGARIEFCRTPILRKSALRPRGLLALAVTSVATVVPAVRLIREAGSDGVYVNTVTIPAWTMLAKLLSELDHSRP